MFSLFLLSVSDYSAINDFLGLVWDSGLSNLIFFLNGKILWLCSSSFFSIFGWILDLLLLSDLSSFFIENH